MAIHTSTYSMLQESLKELIIVADYCIHYRKEKEPNLWNGTFGCYGFPGALILLSIADSIGSYKLNGSVENHFKILIEPNFYNLKLSQKEIKVIYDYYRNSLCHNSALPPEVYLDIGEISSPIFRNQGSQYILNLLPFLEISKQAVKEFLSIPESELKDSHMIKKIGLKNREL